ncbi:MAG: ABC transporter ATP-binding protein [Solirubrobacteraceae bacterium]
MSAGLAVTGLAKSYGELWALRDVSFQAEPGELLAVLGPNGAGKTTLLSLIAGAQSPTAGSVSRSAREIGWAPQQPALYSRLTVAENLELFARLEGVPEPADAIARMLEQTGLRARAGEQVGRLSGGNRQRVNVAIGLIGDPPVLALDEPSASLDPAQRARLWDFLSDVAAAGRTVIFSTHSPAEAQRRAGRVLVLDDGRLVFEGTPEALIERAGTGTQELEEALVRFLELRQEGQQP